MPVSIPVDQTLLPAKHHPAGDCVTVQAHQPQSQESATAVGPTSPTLRSTHARKVYSPIEGLPWLHGQEGLQKDGMGYVYWRGREVEHYSYREDMVGEREAAVRLADICTRMEQLGIEVRGGTVLQHKLLIGLAESNDPAGPLWAAQMSNRQLYAVRRHPDGRVALLFWDTPEDAEPAVCAVVCHRTGEHTRQLDVVTSTANSGVGIDVYYALDRQGFAAGGFSEDADAWLAAVHEVGFLPDDVGEFLDSALARDEDSNLQHPRERA
jgi:hypothetical protein